jgi:hypothetical protein
MGIKVQVGRALYKIFPAVCVDQDELVTLQVSHIKMKAFFNLI